MCKTTKKLYRISITAVLLEIETLIVGPNRKLSKNNTLAAASYKSTVNDWMIHAYREMLNHALIIHSSKLENSQSSCVTAILNNKYC